MPQKEFPTNVGDWVRKLLEMMTFVLFTTMTIIVWAQIFYRFILGDGIIWAEEISKYMMVWMALLGAAIVYYENGHISINFFINKFREHKWLKVLHLLLAAVLFVFLLIYGIDYAEFGKRFISPASGIRRFWPYLAVPVGSVFLLFFFVVHFINVFKGPAKKKDDSASSQ